ncbi:UBA domain-containing protein [Apiospora kogelbergensis]|uniref:UBA domain-containing protein n=1 Tax=Apiospora kogelbergensis TaxID=1337665 RepID=UPI00312FABC2
MSIEAVEAAVPNLNLTPEEKRVYGQLFRQADTESVGVVTGEVAVKFFEKTRLDSSILGEIWQIADQENRGFLTPAGFGLTLRLIGHAQAGRQPSREIALQQGPIPRFEGFTPAGPPVPPPQPSPLQAQGTGGAPIRIPPLTPDKVSQYAGLFERQGSQGNLLPGDQAKSIFEKSGLPNEVLGRIWQLADTEQRGSLVMTEFVIAMHLLTSMKTGALRGLPNVLPAALYEAATRRGSVSRQSPQTTGQPLSAIPRQLSGSAHMRPGGQMPRSPLNPQATGLTPQMSGSDWAVTPIDKQRFDQFYNDLDKTNKGFITGEEAVPFLSQSSLSEEALAQIWDLADINSEGRLTRDTFAVAMFLIRQQRSRRDGSNTVPTTLPPNLIPPSLRTQVRPPTSSGSPFDAPAPAPPPPPPAPKSALDDLFGLDSPAPAPMQAPQTTGGSAAKDPFASASPMPPASPVRASPTGNTFRPFVPSSSFGRGLTTHDTGGSAHSAGGAPKPPASMGGMDDLLGDNDPEISKKLTNETTELANLSNQIGSLSNQMQQVQATRTSTQKDVNQTSQQKKNFETRLAELRAAYEKEVADVNALKQSHEQLQREVSTLMQQNTEVQEKRQKTKQEHETLVAEYQRYESQNASLKQQISEANSEVAQLAPQIEKLKSESRRLKGMVAINSKQLSTVEGQRDKLQSEAKELSNSATDSPRQGSTSSPVPASAQVASPAPSTASANNPFFRRTGSTDMMGAFASPPIAKPFGGDKSFDDIFGGFAPSSSNTPPPPATSFKQQNTGTSTASVGSFATPELLVLLFLPLGNMSESLTSSRQASPPMSRAGEPSALSPAATGQPIEPVATGQSVASAADGARGSDIGSATEETPAVVTDGVPIPGAFPEENPKAVGESPFAGNRDSEIFESMKKEPVSAKDDFDSAFASFPGSSSSGQEKAKDTNNTFTNEGNGFDDDFAPASPTTKKAEAKEAPQSTSPVAANIPAAEGSIGAASSAQSTNATTAPVSQPKEDDPFAPASDFAPAPSTVTNTAPPATKGAFDDLDDEFEGLEDAKEGSADDEFANISRSNMDDFNPMFDSPPPSQPKNESSNASHAFGIDSSYDFGDVSTTSAGAPAISTNATGASATGQGPKSPDNQEWDALFATLDEAPANNGTSESAAPAPKGNESPVSPKSGLAAPRPDASRALSEDGVHDDPILKNLTGMGYSRNDALNALEKYDYNLERAANHLANQS